ncbi:MAG TPA: phosphoglucosamine mutase [bacterium]|jgi:phosphoglucosamine mutase|nr:phosphoglucosamine mutase [bacterium]
MHRRLFGTDGVRGVANVDLTPELVLRLGRAAADVLGAEGGRFLIGRDTRLSGPMLESALAAALCAAGASVQRAGILPTPAVAYLTHHFESTAGIAVSASHNPVEDNGFKFFSRDGFKLSDAQEYAIEAAMDRGVVAADGRSPGGVEEVADALEQYVEFVASVAAVRLAGLRVVVDCAYGAAWRAAPKLWRRLGATVIPINDAPDGSRINVDCGSTHPDVVRHAVLDHGADVGFAHDGDADRVIAVDETGGIVDGDAMMGLCALHLHAQGRLAGGRVVATVMSNLGLELALRRAGVDLERTAVGDRYVLERMRTLDANVGGEQSGHVIFLDHSTTGDGLITAVQVVNVMIETGRRLSELASVVERFPQVLRNVSVPDRARFGQEPAIQAAIDAAARSLGDRGRVLVRPSGTEPLVRVMVEAPDAATADAVAAELAHVVQRTLGSTE